MVLGPMYESMRIYRSAPPNLDQILAACSKVSQCLPVTAIAQRSSSVACLNCAETGSRCTVIKLLQCFTSSNTIQLIKPHTPKKQVLFLFYRRKTNREINLAAISHRRISSNDWPCTQLLQQVCCSVSKNHQKTVRSCNMNNILLDLISIGKSLKGITPEKCKPGFGGIRISDKHKLSKIYPNF